jgi:molecular chaperone GrpE (heat shock protein)
VSAQAGEVAVALSNVLVEELPDAFLEEGVTLLLVRPLDAVFDPARMREVGRQETLGFDGRVVAQRSAGVERGGMVVRHADVVVAG